MSDDTTEEGDAVELPRGTGHPGSGQHSSIHSFIPSSSYTLAYMKDNPPGRLPKPATARNLPNGFHLMVLYGPLPKSYTGLQLASYIMTCTSVEDDQRVSDVQWGTVGPILAPYRQAYSAMNSPWRV